MQKGRRPRTETLGRPPLSFVNQEQWQESWKGAEKESLKNYPICLIIKGEWIGSQLPRAMLSAIGIRLLKCLPHPTRLSFQCTFLLYTQTHTVLTFSRTHTHIQATYFQDQWGRQLEWQFRRTYWRLLPEPRVTSEPHTSHLKRQAGGVGGIGNSLWTSRSCLDSIT